jgi:hypothetical protein
MYIQHHILLLYHVNKISNYKCRIFIQINAQYSFLDVNEVGRREGRKSPRVSDTLLRQDGSSLTIIVRCSKVKIS